MVGGTGNTEKSFVVQKIQELREKTAENQGEIVLCVRNIVTDTPKNHYTSSFSYTHMEAGIISGGLMTGLTRVCQIETSSLVLDSDKKNYTFFASHTIPVEKHLDKGIPFAHPVFDFSCSDLEKICHGEILFGSDELDNHSGYLDSIGFQRRTPYLGSIDFYFGEEEISETFSKDVDVAQLLGFFKLLKVPGKIEKRVRDYKFKIRKSLAEKLVISVANLVGLNREILGIEKDVLNSRLTLQVDQGDTFYDWGTCKKQVRLYESLRNSIIASIRDIEKKLTGSEEIKELPFIHGDCLGFNSEISTAEYLENLTKKILPEINKRIKKLDLHMKEQKENAYK